MNDNLKIAIVICVTIIIIVFSYFLFLSPHARCVNGMLKANPDLKVADAQCLRHASGSTK